MALIGLTASILTDGGEALAALGLAISPAGLFMLTVNIGAESLDAGAALLRNVKTFVDPHVFGLIVKIEDFKAALKLGVEIIDKLARKTFAAVGSWPTGSGDELAVAVYNLMKGQLDKVWQPFEALLRHFGNNGDLGGLYKLGFGEGGFLAGMALTYSDEAVTYGDDVIEGVAKIGNDVEPDIVYNLSNDATAGIGKVVDDMGGDDAYRFINALSCPNVAHINQGRIAGLASPLLSSGFQCIQILAEAYKNLSPTARDGLSRLLKSTSPEDAAKVWDKYKDAGVYRDQLFETLNRVSSSVNPTAAPRIFIEQLELAGGIQKTSKLEELWNLIPSGDPSKADTLLRLVNGNAAKFDQLVDVVPLFKKLPAPNVPQPDKLYGYSSVDFKHFLERHTYDYFVFNNKNIKPDNTMWPIGTTPNNIRNALQEALNHLNGRRKLGHLDQEILTISGNRKVLIGAENDGVGGIMISQFYPLPENGSDYVNFLRDEMRAFRDLLQ